MNARPVQESWDVTRLSGSIGAEVRGLKLGDVGAEDTAAISQLLLEHMVLFFPGQHPTIDEHIHFGGLFGKLEGHPNLKNPHIDHPEIFELVASHGGIADEWHTDITFQDRPALMSVLHMLTCPETGGDTMWSNLCAAYDELSAPLKEMCDGMTALHDAHPHNHSEQMAVHPVVRIHPETGRKALYVNEHFTRRLVEMNATESATLLPYLTQWIQNPRFTVRYHWTPGTVAMWDNRCTQHFVINDFDDERIAQRVTIMGDKPEGSGGRWQPWGTSGPRSATSRLDRQLHRFLTSKEPTEGKLGD